MDQRPSPQIGGAFRLEEIECEHIRRVLEWAPTLEHAATVLGIDRKTLRRKRARYALGRDK